MLVRLKLDSHQLLDSMKKGSAVVSTRVIEGTEETTTVSTFRDGSINVVETAKPVPARMAIISAGVIMNMIFAVILASIAYRLGVEEMPAIVGSKRVRRHQALDGTDRSIPLANRAAGALGVAGAHGRLSGCTRRVLADDVVILSQVCGIGGKLRRIVVAAEGFVRGRRLLQQGGLVRIQDLLENAKDMAREQREIAGAPLDQGAQDLQRHLDVPTSRQSASCACGHQLVQNTISGTILIIISARRLLFAGSVEEDPLL